jgi:hypothetical protein
MHVEQLFVHPLKGGRALSVPALEFDARGPRDDRRWLVVDAGDRFVTQREVPALGRIDARPADGGLLLSVAGGESLRVQQPAAARLRRVQVWADTVTVRDAGDEAARWLGSVLGGDFRLTWQAAEGARPIRRIPSREVSLADGYPLLVVSASAVAELAQRLGAPVDVRRFRPNVVVGDAVAHFEDGVRRLRVGGNSILLPAACQRCVVPSLDPDTLEPTPRFNAVLAGYRRHDGAIWFGCNGVHESQATIRVGDPVEVLEASGGA